MNPLQGKDDRQQVWTSFWVAIAAGPLLIGMKLLGLAFHAAEASPLPTTAETMLTNGNGHAFVWILLFMALFAGARATRSTQTFVKIALLFALGFASELGALAILLRVYGIPFAQMREIVIAEPILAAAMLLQGSLVFLWHRRKTLPAR